MQESKIQVYVHPKCTTCQKALKFLESRKVAFALKDITKTAPSLLELQQMLKFLSGDVKKLFNTSGIQYRELKLSEKLPKLTLEQSLEFLRGNGMLVKRPFLLSENVGLVGFREEQWKQLK